MTDVVAEVSVNDVDISVEVGSNVEAISAKTDIVIPGGGQGLSNDVKDALLQIARKVVYVDAGGATYYNALYEALYPLSSISAVYTQSGTIYDTDTLDDLIPDLVVTATYGDGGTATVPAADYTLFGTLAVGTSTITVTYEGKTATFTVTVSSAPATLSYIEAVYTQSGTVYDTDSLDSLKTDLVVTAHYSDSTTATVDAADYTLSGTLAEGTSTVTVTYEDKTDTFDVTVTATGPVPAGYTAYDYITSPSQHDYSAFNNLISLKQYANLNALSMEVQFKPKTGHQDGGALIGRRSSNASTYSYALYAKTAKLSWHFHGTASTQDTLRPDIVEEAVNVVKFTNTSSSPSSIQTNENTPISITWANNQTLNLAPALFANPFDTTSYISIIGKLELGYVKFYDLSGDLVGHYIPCIRDADNIIGMYDAVEGVFYTSPNATVATAGGSGHFYEVGNWS